MEKMEQIMGMIYTFYSPNKNYDCVDSINNKWLRFFCRQGFSVFVGDLTEDVDDLLLYSTFSKRYPSCRLAKVVLNEEGASRGYGFVRFEDQDEQKRAMIEMQGHRGLGGKPIRVSPAQHKKAT